MLFIGNPKIVIFGKRMKSMQELKFMGRAISILIFIRERRGNMII
jgi:hypothetical protein